jgi:hypothetical protein
MQFDALVAALPLSSEEDQLKRIQELQVGTRQIRLICQTPIFLGWASGLLPTVNCAQIWDMQAENEVVGLELQKQLEAAGNMFLTV